MAMLRAIRITIMCLGSVSLGRIRSSCGVFSSHVMSMNCITGIIRAISHLHIVRTISSTSITRVPVVIIVAVMVARDVVRAGPVVVALPLLFM